MFFGGSLRAIRLIATVSRLKPAA